MYRKEELLQLLRGASAALRTWVPVLEPGMLGYRVRARVTPVPMSFQHIMSSLLACPAC